MSKLLKISWLLLALVLCLYSYGFVDLNLTLSAHPFVFNFVSSMQQLVYFDRALSLKVFIGIITLMFVLYLGTLMSWQSKKDTSFPWRFVAALSLLLALAYPMLSSDVFKYLFVGKEILVYHANPYTVTPNMFPADTWIRFMRWVHTTTPYGPVFTALALPYYLISLGKFVPMLYLFKLSQIGWYLLSIWLIGKMGNLRAQLFFALNPLILMEWLINAHNDAIMITLLLLSLYLHTQKKRVWSGLAILCSIGIKYVTVIFLPILFLSKKIPLHTILWYLFLTLLLAPLLYHYSWQYQPWYVSWIIPFAALLPSRTLRCAVGTYSLSVFSRYLFFVGTGSWLGTPLEHALMTFLPPAIVLVAGGVVQQAGHNRAQVRKG